MKMDYQTVFQQNILIGIGISNNLFFQKMRRLKPYKYKISILKFSFYTTYKNAILGSKSWKNI